MCFELGSCFGKGRREDYGGEPSTPKTACGGLRKADRRNDYYRSTTDPKAPAYHHQPRAMAVDEAGHKAYHDGVRRGHHAGGYAAYVQDKQTDSGGVRN